MIVYLAGKYTGKDEAETATNIALAESVAVQLWDHGYTVISPHLNMRGFETKCKTAKYENFMAGCLEMMLRCETLILLPGWESSKGARLEEAVARNQGISIVWWSELLEKWGDEEYEDKYTR